MSTTVPIADLASEISLEDAVSIAYREDIDWIERRLRNRLSVLIECDKQLSFFLFRLLRTRLKQTVDGEALSFQVIDGRPQQQQEGQALPQQQSVLQLTVANLQQHVFQADQSRILVIPHLDLLTTTTRSGLSMETREVAALLYENPNLVMLAFRDPSFELPKVIETCFPAHRSVMGIARQKLPQLITRGEARKFAAEEFSPYELFKFTSGLNAVRFRQVMQHFSRHRDFDPRVDDVKDRYKELRELTVAAEFQLPDVRFDRDIAGYRRVKEQLRKEILDLVDAKDKLSEPRQIEAIEKLIPRGIIFQGPPGTGKTLFAKAMATELNATVIVVSGPEVKSKWVGETEANIRRIFAQARRSAPSLIVFEEMDSIAPSREREIIHEVTHSTVNQILTEMDGFRSEELVFVCGTTNFAASLDAALLRPGRFELKIRVDNPHDYDREDIIKLYREKLQLDMADDVVSYMVKRTRGFADPQAGHHYTGDHIFALCKSLKREELREGKGAPIVITKAHIDGAIESTRAKKRVPSDEELLASATHEAGHAVLQEVLPDHPPLDKVTIQGDDEGMGPYYTLAETPANEWEFYTESELRDFICACYGGRLAESILLGRTSIGAAMDLYQATRIAQIMVAVEGMSRRSTGRSGTGFQPVSPSQAQSNTARPESKQSTHSPDGGHGQDAHATGDDIEFLRALTSPFPGGRDLLPPSDDTRERIDAAVDRILRAEYERARETLNAHRDLLTAIRDRLLEKKELTRAEIADLLPEAANDKAKRFDEKKKQVEARRKQSEPDRDRNEESKLKS